MRNNYHANNHQARSSTSAKGDLLLAPSDAYDFKRAMSTESTETVRAGKLVPAITNTINTITNNNNNTTNSGSDATAMQTTPSLEDRVPVSPEKPKLPPTPPREHYHCHNYYEAEPKINLLPPSATSMVRNASVVPRVLLEPPSWGYTTTTTTNNNNNNNNFAGASIFRASPLLERERGDGDGHVAHSREDRGFYTLHRSPAFEDDEC